MVETTWLEVSLVVDGELAEAVAEVLGRFAPGGVAIESTAVTANPDDAEGHAVGPLRVVAYLRANPQIEETRHRLEEALWYLSRIRTLPEPQYRTLADTNWAEAWKKHYHPIQIGEKLVIVPAWLESEDPQRIPVRIDPGMAFGTGTHPTTQLCLEMLEAWLSRPSAGQPVDVIDLGCGTAILAVAALKLGARQALGVDIDADAAAAAGENAARNEVADRLETAQGSLSGILAGQFNLRQGHLVLANILAPVLVRLLDEGLGKLVAPGGYLVLSGILDTQAAEVVAAAERQGLRLEATRQISDWVALGFVHKWG